VLAQEGTEDAGQEVLGDGGGGCEAEFSRDGLVEGGEGEAGFVECGGGGGGVAEEDATGFGEGDLAAMAVAGGAIEEPDAGLFFEGADLLADSGLAEIESFGGFAEAELVGDLSKDGEAKVFHGLLCVVRSEPAVLSESGQADR
jgi:hypothetical protein